MPKLTPGKIVLYKLSEEDCWRIKYGRWQVPKRKAVVGEAVFEAKGDAMKDGNDPRPGDVVPAIVVCISPTTPNEFNGQAFLDGNDTLWLTSVAEGDHPGQWQWPFIAELKADPEAMAGIKRGIEDIRAGRVHSWEDVKKELGTPD